MYQLRELLFDKLNSFGFLYTDNQKRFKNMTSFNFESISVKDENLNFTNTTTWIGEHILILLSMSSFLVQETVFICHFNHHDMVSSFTDVPENLAMQSKAQMKMKFLQIETATKSQLARVLEILK